MPAKNFVWKWQYLTHGETTAAVPEAVLHNVKFREFHVDWYDVNEVYMFSEAASSRMFRYVTNKLSIQKPGTGTRLYRGYCEEATMDDKPPDVTRLVFVVHGIGQKYNQNRIITCCNSLRNGTEKLIPKHFPDLTGSCNRAEFLPVEWRTDLSLDGDLVDSITPDKLKNLRVILNSTAMDILYYTSPLYRGEIINGLCSELNRLYAMFIERHPYFEANNGQVSICAHSLGSVILYDILTGWDPIELYDQYVCKLVSERSKHDVRSEVAIVTDTERSKKLHDFYINSIVHKESSPLSFKVTSVFSLGSPLGVFLTLRGMRPKSNGLMDHLLPKTLCKRFYNIYHPSDPVAYRMEPLVLKHYSTIAPLKIHKVHDAKKTPYSEMKAKAYAAFGAKKAKRKHKKPVTPRDQSAVRSEDDMGSLSGSTHTVSSDGASMSPASPAGSTGKANGAISKEPATPGSRGGLTGAVKGFFSRFGGQPVKADEKLASELDEYVTSEDDTDDVKSDDGNTIEHTDLEYRLDYVLPMGSMTNSYVSAIFSHTSYWASPEIALFILSHVFPEYGPVQ